MKRKEIFLLLTASSFIVVFGCKPLAQVESDAKGQGGLSDSSQVTEKHPRSYVDEETGIKYVWDGKSMVSSFDPATREMVYKPWYKAVKEKTPGSQTVSPENTAQPQVDSPLDIAKPLNHNGRMKIAIGATCTVGCVLRRSYMVGGRRVSSEKSDLGYCPGALFNPGTHLYPGGVNVPGNDRHCPVGQTCKRFCSTATAELRGARDQFCQHIDDSLAYDNDTMVDFRMACGPS